jgi:hypothetical protein
LTSARHSGSGPATAQRLAEGYVADNPSGDTSVLELFCPSFYDNVSGTHGFEVFDLVRDWLDESFADRSADL